MKKFFKEFKEFMSKGNAFDLAVGLVIGTAFNAIIKSLVNDIIMPLLGLIVNTDISKLYWVLRGTATYDITTGSLILSENAVLMRYGSFLETVLNFLIIALSIFITIKIVKKFETKLGDVKVLLFKEAEEPIQETE